MDGRIVEMGGRSEAEFDLIDHFIATKVINLEAAKEAMRTDLLELARMLVDTNVPRTEVARRGVGARASG